MPKVTTSTYRQAKWPLEWGMVYNSF
jgi:hypothetical protein